MRLIIPTLICFVLWLETSAQRLVYNEKAPVINMSAPYYGLTPDASLPTLIEFVTVDILNVEEHLAKVDLLANSEKGLNVVVVINGDKDKVEALFNNVSYKFSVIYDLANADNYFTWYDVRYVPKCVVLDAKSNFIWQGKLSQFSSAIIRNSISGNKNKK